MRVLRERARNKAHLRPSSFSREGVERASQLFEGYPSGMLVTTPSGATHTEPNPRPYDELAAVWAQLNPLYEIDAGSNAWVVGGHWTTTGMPLVAGDRTFLGSERRLYDDIVTLRSKLR